MTTEHKPHSELRELVLDYLRTDDFPDGWITPDEISDQATPDLLLARGLWRTLEQFEALVAAARPFAEAWDYRAMQYLAEKINGEEYRVIEARLVSEMIEQRDALRAALPPAVDFNKVLAANRLEHGGSNPASSPPSADEGSNAAPRLRTSSTNSEDVLKGNDRERGAA